MRNLVYTSFNRAYQPLWDSFVRGIVKHGGDVTICAFSETPPQGVDIWIRKAWNPNLHKLWIGDYDLGFDAYLYLDLDVLCRGSLVPVFDAINRIRGIHGKVEHPDIMAQGEWHRDANASFPPGTPAYNAGTFGFPSEALTDIQALRWFTELENNPVSEQVAFNSFGHGAGLLVPTLNPFVELVDCNSAMENLTVATPLIHFVGNCGNIDMKISAFQKYERSYPD